MVFYVDFMWNKKKILNVKQKENDSWISQDFTDKNLKSVAEVQWDRTENTSV